MRIKIIQFNLMIFALLCVFTNISCNKVQVTFYPDNVKEAFLLVLEDSGENTINHFYFHGIQEIVKLLNTRKAGKVVRSRDSQNDVGKYYLRLELQNGPCTILFYDEHNFKMEYLGSERNYSIPNFLDTLISMDKHPAFDSADVVSVRIFNQDLKAISEIPAAKIIPLLDTLNTSRDEYILKSLFSEPPQFILRIQLYSTGYQVFCGNEFVWIPGKNGVFVYKSAKIKNILKEIKNIPVQRPPS